MAEYTTDNDIRERNDNFWIVRILKFSLLIVLLIGIGFITYYFISALQDNSVFRQSVLDTVWQQVGTISVAIMAIFGVNKFSK